MVRRTRRMIKRCPSALVGLVRHRFSTNGILPTVRDAEKDTDHREDA